MAEGTTSPQPVVQDDEETLSLLLSKSLPSAELKERLVTVAQRFANDGDNVSVAFADWQSSVLSSSAAKLVPCSTTTSTGQQHSETAPRLPAALASPQGKRHLQATAALLQVSEESTVVSLTLGALRTVVTDKTASSTRTTKTNTADSSSSSSYSALLGTRALVLKVLEYAGQQQVARLAILAEALKVEQDFESSTREAVLTLLDTLDDRYELQQPTGGANNNHKRGIFQLLLAAVSCTNAASNKAQKAVVDCEAARALSSSSSLSQPERSSSSRPTTANSLTDEKDWNQFQADVQYIQAIVSRQVQAEALDALIALLYNRLQGGVTRTDLNLLLAALPFHNEPTAITTWTTVNQWYYSRNYNHDMDQRMAYRAALLGAEAMALWRLTEPDEMAEHPLLQGLTKDTTTAAASNTAAAVEDLQAIGSTLKEWVPHIMQRNNQYNNNRQQQPIQAPEALTMLSFGLLLQSAAATANKTTTNNNNNNNNDGAATENDHWKSLGDLGLELIDLANNCDAFGYLHTVMCAVVQTIPSPQENLALYKTTGGELDASSLIYASIGRELLNAAIYTLKDKILGGTRQTALTTNVNMLCNLAAVIHRNSPILSEQLWSDWDAYTTSSDDNGTEPTALCTLLHAAHTLASAAKQNRGERFVAGVTPLLRFVSALVHSADMVESALASVIPPGLLSQTLEQALAPGQDESFVQCRTSFLESICALANIADDTDRGRLALRQALDGNSGSVGPKMLLQMAFETRDDQACSTGLAALAHLLPDAPLWTLEVARAIEMMQSFQGGWRGLVLRGNPTARQAAKLMDQMVQNWSALIFSNQLDEAGILKLLEVTMESVFVVASLLSSAIPIASKHMLGGQQLSFETASAIMDCISTCFRHTGPIVELHPSLRVREAVYDIRTKLVDHLVGSVGMSKAIMYYAGAPVSLSLAIATDARLRDADVIKAMQEKTNKYALFTDLIGREADTKNQGSDIKSMLMDALSDPDNLVFNFSELQVKGMFSQEDDVLSPLRAAHSAFALLELWSRVAESFVGNNGADLTREELFSLSTLSPYQLLASPVSLPPLSSAGGVLPSLFHEASIPYVSLFSRFVACTGGSDSLENQVSSRAMDFLMTALLHGKMCLLSGIASADSIFKEIFEAGHFCAAIRTTAESLTKEDENDLERTKGLLCLRILADCADVSPALACRMIGIGTTTSILNSLTEKVKSVATILVSKEKSGQLLQSSDRKFADDLRLGYGCLNVLRSVWKCARLDTEPGNLASFARKVVLEVEQQSLLLPELLKVFLACGGLEALGQCGDASSRKLSSNLCGFTRLAIDVVATELLLSQQKPDKKEKVSRYFESSFEGNLSKFITLSQSFMAVSSFHQFASQYEGYKTSIAVLENHMALPASRLIGVSGISSMIGSRDYFSDNTSSDSIFAEQWFAMFAKEPSGMISSDPCSFEDLVELYHLLSSELSLLESWKRFLILLAKLESKHWRGDSRPTAVLSLAMARQALLGIKNSLGDVDETESKELLANEACEIAVGLSCLPSHLVSSADMSHDDAKELVETVGLIAECCKGFKRSPFPAEAVLSCLKHLLASASVLLDSPVPFWSQPGSKGACSELGAISCWTVASVEQQVDTPSVRAEGRKCLPICISVLASLTTQEENQREASSWEDGAGYSRQMYHHFATSDVVRSLVRQTSRLSHHSMRADGVTVDTKCEVAQLVLSLFARIAAVGDSDMLTLLANGETPLILPKGSEFSCFGDDSFPMRGYKDHLNFTLDDPAEETQKTGARGRDNPNHLVWRASMKFITSSLRSTAARCHTETANRFRFMAVDFLIANENSLMACLEQCSSISFDSKKSPVLTLNVLKEASLILSIVSELCTAEAGALFKDASPGLFETMLNASSSLLPGLGRFLGAASCSRELFRAIEDLEAADASVLDSVPQLAALGNMYYALAGGISNARHEAIRYSHFVMHATAAVTEADNEAMKSFPSRWQPGTRKRSFSDPQSLTSLEQSCRESVTGLLAFRLECEAAQVLFFALNILWRTHPTASSFVMFSPEEIARLDTMQLVQPGSMIAYRERSQSLIAAGFNDKQPEPPLEYAEVVRCDTVGKRWIVCRWDYGQPVQTFVSANQLAGIEDAVKRRGILSLDPAPQSFTELERSSNKASTGHLILALRWCSQFFVEMQDSQVDLPMGRSVASRLAELAGAFLGTELSIAKEVSQRHTGTDEVPQSFTTVCLQVLDLFGEKSEFDELLAGTGPLPVQRNGRLQPVVSTVSWESVRQQLRDEIGHATDQLKVRVYNRNQQIDNNGALLVRRTSTSRSPFRGISL